MQWEGARSKGALEARGFRVGVGPARGQHQEGPVFGQGGKLGAQAQRGGVGPVQVLQGKHGGAYGNQA